MLLSDPESSREVKSAGSGYFQCRDSRGCGNVSTMYAIGISVGINSPFFDEICCVNTVGKPKNVSKLSDIIFPKFTLSLFSKENITFYEQAQN